MATPIQTIITASRKVLLRYTERYWSDAELVEICNDGIKDLWKKVIDLYQGHIVTRDITTMSIAADTDTVSGVPTDLFRIVNIRPRTVGPNSSNPGLIFKPRTITHPDFVASQAMRSRNPRQCLIYYAVLNAGAPVGAPTIALAPTVSSQVLLAVDYNPVIANKVLADNNPIPGESDKALKHYVIAFARSREREDRAPDPEHLSIYATEARNLQTVLTPRSIQEPEYVVGMWEGSGEGAPDFD